MSNSTVIYRSHELRALKANTARLRARVEARRHFLKEYGEAYKMPLGLLKKNIAKYDRLIKHIDIILTIEMTDI